MLSNSYFPSEIYFSSFLTLSSGVSFFPQAESEKVMIITNGMMIILKKDVFFILPVLLSSLKNQAFVSNNR